MGRQKAKSRRHSQSSRSEKRGRTHAVAEPVEKRPKPKPKPKRDSAQAKKETIGTAKTGQKLGDEASASIGKANKKVNNARALTQRSPKNTQH